MLKVNCISLTVDEVNNCISTPFKGGILFLHGSPKAIYEFGQLVMKESKYHETVTSNAQEQQTREYEDSINDSRTILSVKEFLDDNNINKDI